MKISCYYMCVYAYMYVQRYMYLFACMELIFLVIVNPATITHEQNQGIVFYWPIDIILRVARRSTINNIFHCPVCTVEFDKQLA